MNNQKYEQFKHDCWIRFKTETMFTIDEDAFKSAFDRAYALGKQEKDAEDKEVLTCEKRAVLYRFRMAEACKTGNNPESDYWIWLFKSYPRPFRIRDMFFSKYLRLGFADDFSMEAIGDLAKRRIKRL